MKQSLVFGALVAALVVSAGCKKSVEAQLVGKWKVKSITGATGPQADMAKSSVLEFKEDKKFAITSGIPMEGDWKVEGSSVTMTLTSVAGQTVAALKQQINSNPMLKAQAKGIEQLDKPSTATLSEDGKTLTTKTAGSPITTIFEKDSSS